MSFSPFDAALWTAGVTFTLILLARLVLGDTESPDLVTGATLQILVYLLGCALFAFRRQGKNFSELFALRRTSAWLFVIALLLGPALIGPAETLGRFVEWVAPRSDAEIKASLELLLPKSIVQGTLLFALAALGGPFVEELFYRGAIYTALRPGYAVGSAIWTTAMCFTLCHPDSRVWPQILPLALVITTLRARGGSLWPPFLAHAAFNGANVGIVFAYRGELTTVPPLLEVGGWVASGLLVAAALLVASRSSLAEQARVVDESPSPAPGV
jgi:membrane protease YdiL (CAAX protease family)